MTAPVALDVSERSVLVACAWCPSWRETWHSVEAAQLAAARHLAGVHKLNADAKDYRERARRIRLRRAARDQRPAS